MEKIENLLLCVGAQKSGTTWLAKMLTGLKEVEFSKYKEIHYFDCDANLNHQLENRICSDIGKATYTNKDIVIKNLFENKNNAFLKIKSLINEEWYLNQFTKKKMYCADFTPEYALLDSKSMNNIKLLSKKQKIIFIMREPVGRTLSAIQYFYQNRNIDIADIGTEELNKKLNSKLFIDRSLYDETIRNLKLNFNSEDVLFLFYEEMMAEKQEHINKVCQFLSIDEIKIDEDKLNKKINSSSSFVFESSTINFLKNRLADVVKNVEKEVGYIPSSWRNK